MDGMTNWGPMNSDADWGPMSTANNWVNDTDIGFYLKTNNKTESTGYARADGKYVGELQNRLTGQGKNYATGNADQYYKGQIDNRGQTRGEGRFEGYGRQGYLGYVPTNGNYFPAPAY
jgi:hypothetical protein